jgi:hypothetical protein
MLLLTALIVVVPAAGAAPVRSIKAPAPVTSLEFDGSRIVYATGRSAGDCNRVFIWNLATRAVIKLGRRTHCEQTSTGNAIAGVSIAGSRALWVHYAGGNIREWSLWTATTTRPRPTRLRFLSRDVDSPAPIVIGPGDSSRFGELLPYAVDRDVVALRANGARRFTWRAPARVVALSALAGELAVATEDATVTILDAAGRVVGREEIDGAITDIRLTGDGLLVQRGGRLELRRASIVSWRISSPARLQDATGDQALYVHRGEVRSLRFSPFLDRGVELASVARLEGATLATASGRVVRARAFR